MKRILCLSLIALVWLAPRPAQAYIEAPHSFGAVVTQSSNIVVLTVTSVDRAKNIVIYRKVRDLKGVHQGDVIKHLLKGELKAGEIKMAMAWAEVGKTAVFFHNGGQGEVCYGTSWYQIGGRGEWWEMTHGEPFLLRSFAGRVEKLIPLVLDVAAGKEVLVPCMIDAVNKEDLHQSRAKIQKLRCSLKLLDYNPKRDFAGWGGEDIRRLGGMPGFSQIAPLSKVDADNQSTSAIDFDGDGRIDICLAGTSRVVLMKNAGDSFSEAALPGLVGGCRSAVWADYNGDGKPDLLLATPTGPKLYTNLGEGNFRDDSQLLPTLPANNLGCAAWIDADGDGLPDILLGNNVHGLTLLKNKRPADAVAKTAPPRLGGWSHVGPFDNAGGTGGFDAVYPPETEIDYAKEYAGREKVKWKKVDHKDGTIQNLKAYKPEFNDNSVVYLHREIECTSPTTLPVSFGSDDGLKVWCNGELLIADNRGRVCAPDQNRAVLKLKVGKNSLLVKVTQGSGEWAYHFAPGVPQISDAGWFVDVSAEWGLGAAGLGQMMRGDSLLVADLTGDGRPDILYGAGSGMLLVNDGKTFTLKADSGLKWNPLRTGPTLCDFDNDGKPDLFIPQRDGKCLLYRNDGDGKFTDVAAASGDLAKAIPGATSAAWGDFNNDGRPDLFVGCLRGCDRYFENAGDGRFVEKTDAIGLSAKIFNSGSLALADINGDGRLDLIVGNEGQDSAVLFGAADEQSRRSAVTIFLDSKTHGPGSRTRVLAEDGKALATEWTTGADGRGGQSGPHPRFALMPGKYQLELRDAVGKIGSRELVVTTAPQKLRLDPVAAPAAVPAEPVKK